MAVFSVYHTIRGEKKYKLNSFAASRLSKFTIDSKNVGNASRYEAVNYFILQDLLKNFTLMFPDEFGFFDVGCGKGRAMVVAAHYGFKDLIGVDFAKELCEEAERNLEQTRKEFPAMEYKILCMDVLDYPVTTESVFFLFNPFDEVILDRFLENINRSLESHPRHIYILYASPRHKDVLKKHNYVDIYTVKRVRYLEGLIAMLSRESG